jgi:hypothetical protein
MTSVDRRFVACTTCKHDIGSLTCEAFDGQIPDQIVDGAVDHGQPYPGDHGIQYEPKS